MATDTVSPRHSPPESRRWLMNTRWYRHACLMFVLASCSAFAQRDANSPEIASESGQCHTVALTVDSPALPYSLFTPYLEKQKNFQASALQLSDDSLAADVFVHLSEGAAGSTRIVVVNRRTHESRTVSTSWTEYPGMVAADVMSEVRLVCRGPAALVAREVPVAPAPGPSELSNPTIEASHGHGFKHFMGRTA